MREKKRRANLETDNRIGAWPAAHPVTIQYTRILSSRVYNSVVLRERELLLACSDILRGEREKKGANRKPFSEPSTTYAMYIPIRLALPLCNTFAPPFVVTNPEIALLAIIAGI